MRACGSYGYKAMEKLKIISKGRDFHRMFTVKDMLDNAACASQEIELLDDRVLRGAVLRSIVQWLELSGVTSIDEAIKQLKNNEDYDR